MTTNLTLRIDADLKTAAEELFEELGMSLSTAFNVFVRQAVRVQGMPFAIGRTVAHRKTMAALAEARQLANDPTPGFDSMEAFVKSLES